LLSVPARANEINAKLLEQRQLQDRIAELRKNEEGQIKPVADRLTAVTKELIEVAKPTPIAKEVVEADGAPVNFADLPKADPQHLQNGRRLFTERGCLACHSHDGTTKADKENHFSPLESQANFGPNLTRLAAKLGTANDKGQIDEASKKRWLVQWLLNPMIHHPRTRMPVTFLAPADASDVADWLLSQAVTDWTEKDAPVPTKETLVALARVYLAKVKDMTTEDVDTILPEHGDVDPAKVAARLNYVAPDADERVLGDGKVDESKLEWYIARKSITRLGCFGCHDMPGFENAKPIGTALNDWGKKDAERLAFEDADSFVKKHFNIVPLRDPAKQLALEATVKRLAEKKEKGDPALSDAETAELGEAEKALKEMKWETKDKKPPYDKYFFERLEHHRREGFLNQKLVEPRSYDYGRIRAWDDRLRMPQFQFARSRQRKNETDEDYDSRKMVEEAEAREAVMTFILGLVAEPVPLKYVNQPRGDRLNEVKGRQVLDKFNCAGCHQVLPGRYEFKKSTDSLGKLDKAFERVKSTLASDFHFPNHNAWTGKPSPFPDRYVAFGVDPHDNDEGFVVRLAEALRFTGADGATRDLPQSSNATMPPEDLLDRNDPLGGIFPALVIGRPGKQTEPRYPDEPVGYLATRYDQRFGDKGADALSALPPPLIREGERVQPRWLYQFLLNPLPVRPQGHMLLRMPRFNMSPDESMALVNFFGSVSKVSNPDADLTIPYLKIEQLDSGFWRQKSQEYVRRLEAAKMLDSRLKEVEPSWKIALQQEKSDLEGRRDTLKKLIEAEKDAETKKQQQLQLTALEASLTKVAEQLAKGDFSAMRDRFKQEDAYAVDAYRLLMNKDLCQKCHSIGKFKIEGEIGPNLGLAADRLRPEWTMYWLSNPNRMFPYSTQMPQNFPSDKIQWQESFVGPPLDQIKAVRDVLMDLPRVADMPANRTITGGQSGGVK
jgi:mono/diheme cytochrome c family protein